MRISEITDAQGQLELLRTVIDNTWTAMNLPLLDVPLSRSFMRPSAAVPRASFSQTASD
jgi:hypothetical protein